MSAQTCTEIAEWFIKRHKEWTQENKLVSWAQKLGIVLNDHGTLKHGQLFHLLVLAILWNSKPTYEVEKGVEVFGHIKEKYTLQNFDEAVRNQQLRNELRLLAHDVIGNSAVFNALSFATQGTIGAESVWSRIIMTLEAPEIGSKDHDLRRLRGLYGIFDPKNGLRQYKGKAYLTVKAFLVFRELRIQFRDEKKYQYCPEICCIPDSVVRNALSELDLLDDTGTNLDNLIHASELVAENFCNERYELYDLPLFFRYRKAKRSQNSRVINSIG